MSDTYYVILMGMFVIIALSRLFSAFFGDGSADDQYMQAREGSSSDDMEKLKALAKEGHASALASFTWACLNKGQYQRATSLYDKTRHLLTQAAGGPESLAWELANVDNNHALNLLGSGKTIEEVGHLWTRNENTGNVESRFYSIVFRVRTKGAPVSNVKNMSSSERQEILQILRKGSQQSVGWYKKWCVEILNEFASNLK